MVRSRLLLLGLSVWLGLGACVDEATAPPSDNVLSLDLGGNYPSLREDLRRTAPSRKPEPATAEAGGSIEAPAVQPSATQPDPAPRPRPRPEPKPEFLVVQLGEGQTLYGLCKAQLGSGGRWREVARLNGWSEDQAGRLRAGQTVKLPLR